MKDQIHVKILKHLDKKFFLSYEDYDNEDIDFELLNLLDDYEDYDELKANKNTVIEEIIEKLVSMFNIISIKNIDAIKAKIKTNVKDNIKNCIFRRYNCNGIENEVQKAIDKKLGGLFDNISFDSDMDEFMKLGETYQKEIIEELKLNHR